MLVSEIFYSLQGEGIYSGVPSIFIRTYGCSLSCSLCDSKYAISGKDYFSMEVDEITTQIAAGYKNVNHIVITGGEPMIQPDIEELVRELNNGNYNITIETNGIRYKNLKVDLFSISPKMSNSYFGKEESKTIYEKNNTFEYIPKFIDSGCRYQFKFIVKTVEDIDEILEFRNRFHILNKDIFLMPEGVTKEEQQSKMEFVSEFCKKYRFNLCPRLHIYIWGNKRGV